MHRQATALLEGMGFSFNRANKHLFIDKLKRRDGKKCDINMSARKTVKRPPDRDPEVRGQEKGLFEGGSLISEEHILTTAHWMERFAHK